MAINYNLAKVYELSDNDPEFVMQIISLFVSEVPDDMKQIEIGIENKDHKLAYSYAHKIKPTLDLLGMTTAHQEILEVEAWTKREGKRKEINETFLSIKNQVEKAVKEINKDYDL
jgi:HPt (histidine-containing phosphotransfer) domain-containing protein